MTTFTRAMADWENQRELRRFASTRYCPDCGGELPPLTPPGQVKWITRNQKACRTCHVVIADDRKGALKKSRPASAYLDSLSAEQLLDRRA